MHDGSTAAPPPSGELQTRIGLFVHSGLVINVSMNPSGHAFGLGHRRAAQAFGIDVLHIANVTIVHTMLRLFIIKFPLFYL